jgi:hypothetical protein
MRKSVKLSQGSDARRRRVRIILRPVREAKGLRAVSLPTGRHEIGSDPQCGIRLVAPGIELKHCEIIVRRDSVNVRAFSRFTWINDGVVKEGSLRAGDRLSLGPVEFEIVKPKRRRRNQDGATAIIRPFIDQSGVQRSLKAAIERTEQAIAEHRLRVTEHLTETPSDEEQRRTWQERIAASQIERALLERRAGLIQELRGDVLRQLGELIQRETLAAERERIIVEDSARLEGRRRSLEEQSAAIDGTRAELRSQQERVTHERAEIGIATQELNSVRERLSDERVRIAAENAAVETAREALSRRAGELEYQSQGLERKFAELDAREAAIEAKAADCTSQSAALNLRAGELDDWNHRIAASDSQVADRIRRQSEDEQALEGQRLELQQEREGIQAEKDAIAEERGALEELVASTQARKERIDRREQELTELEASFSRNLEEIAAGRSELERREADLEIRRLELSGRETALAVADEQIAQAERLQRGIAFDQAELERRRAELQCDAGRLEAERASIARENHRLTAAAADIAEREARLAASNAAIEDSQCQQSAQADSIAEIHRLRELLSAQESDLANGRNELAAARITLQQEEEHLAERHRALELSLANVEARAAEIESLRERVIHESECLEARRRECEESWSTRQLAAADVGPDVQPEQSLRTETDSERLRQIEELQARLAEFEHSIAAERSNWISERESLTASAVVFGNDLNAATAQAAELDARRRDLETELAAIQEQIRQEREAFDRARENWDAEQDLLVRDRMALEAEWRRLEAHVNQAYSPPIPAEDAGQAFEDQTAVDELTPPPIPFDESVEPQPYEQPPETDSEVPEIHNCEVAEDQFSADGFQFSQSAQVDEQAWNAEAVNSGAPDDVLKLRAELASLFGIQPGAGPGSAEESNVEGEAAYETAAVDEATESFSQAPVEAFEPQAQSTEFGVERAETNEVVAPVESGPSESFDSDPSSTTDDLSLPEGPAEETHEEIMSAYLDRILGRDKEPREVTRHSLAPQSPQASTSETPHHDAESHAPRHARRLNDEEKVALRANMDSFRELANKQARAAVAKHKSNELKSGLQLTSVICVLIAVIGVVLLTAELWSSTSYRGIGVLTLSVAGAMGMWILANSIKIRQLQALQNFAKEDLQPAEAAGPTVETPTTQAEVHDQPEAVQTSEA